tara:strand:+ start:483 stop:1028 length:546 start_codon:yes stop_codon:yes gene_type:complete
MQLHEAIQRGAVHLENNFFTDEIYKDVYFNLKQVNFNACYQPAQTLYYNRLEAYPCHEYWYNRYDEFILLKLRSLLGCELKDFKCFARKLIGKELKKSPQGSHKYGLVHKDDMDFACVLSLDESVNNGTAFYEHQFHRAPYMEVGAYPNRLVLYSGHRYHSTCYDFNLEESTKLVMFFNKD